jgi:hypothetical protein
VNVTRDGARNGLQVKSVPSTSVVASSDFAARLQTSAVTTKSRNHHVQEQGEWSKS